MSLMVFQKKNYFQLEVLWAQRALYTADSRDTRPSFFQLYLQVWNLKFWGVFGGFSYILGKK